MKKIILFLMIISSSIVLVAQSNLVVKKTSISTEMDGKYAFIYNDNNCIVELSLSTNSFKEYDENENQLTRGNFEFIGGVYYLTPESQSATSQISIPVNFTIAKVSNHILEIIFNSSQVKNYSLKLTRL